MKNENIMKGADQHYLAMAVHGELRRLRKFIRENREQLEKQGILEDQEKQLKCFFSLRTRLQGCGFVLALPLSIGAKLFAVQKTTDCVWQIVEDVLVGYATDFNDKGEIVVALIGKTLHFALSDLGEMVFHSYADALNKCISLNAKIV